MKGQFTRRRDSKQLQFRGAGGRYARHEIDVKACMNLECRRFILPLPIEKSESGLIDPFTVKRYPEKCPHCGTALET